MPDLTVDGRARPGSGVDRFCCQLIEQGVPAKEIAERARERFGGKTSVDCVRWYASRMRTGKLSPDGCGRPVRRPARA